MINIPTALVLGAGASAPYGYPTGANLLNEILYNTLSPENLFFLSSYGIDRAEAEEFISSLDRSEPSSIDFYLEHRKEHINIGKLMISKIIIQREDNESLKRNWYQQLTTALNCSLDNFHLNKLSIITFNYDRSLEQYLFNVLKPRYNISDTKCRELINSIPIIHVHGKLFPLDWEGHPIARKYDSRAAEKEIFNSSSMISIVHEQDAHQNELFKEAKEVLNNASKIYFLGFGYHQISLDRLDISNINISNKDISGTRFNLSQRQVDQIVRRNNGNIRLGHVGSHLDISGFLKEHVDLE